MDETSAPGRQHRRLLMAVLLTACLAGPAAIAAAEQSSGATSASGSTSATEAKKEADRLLVRPKLKSPTTVTMTASTWTLVLDPTRDYILKIAPGTTFTKSVKILGGHNVVFENAVLQYAPPLGASPQWLARGLELINQTGVMWVSNLQIHGPLTEGIDLSQKKLAAVVLHNVQIDPVSGSKQTNHADLLQTWAGPARLVVDGLYGVSNFQGVFLQPNDTWRGPHPKWIVIRHVHIDVSRGIYALSSYAHGAYPIVAEDITVDYNPLRPSRDQWLWPKPSTGDKTWVKVVGIGPESVAGVR